MILMPPIDGYIILYGTIIRRGAKKEKTPVVLNLKMIYICMCKRTRGRHLTVGGPVASDVGMMEYLPFTFPYGFIRIYICARAWRTKSLWVYVPDKPLSDASCAYTHIRTNTYIYILKYVKIHIADTPFFPYEPYSLEKIGVREERRISHSTSRDRQSIFVDRRVIRWRLCTSAVRRIKQKLFAKSHTHTHTPVYVYTYISMRLTVQYIGVTERVRYTHGRLRRLIEIVW